MARSGRITGEDTPRFSSPDTVMMETGVTSEPVPAVVGTNISGRRGPFALPTPQASSMSSPDPASNAASFATSIDDPPPNPTMPLAAMARALSVAAIRVASEGSASTASKTVTAHPACSSEAMAGAHSPSFIRPASVMNRTDLPSLVPAISPSVPAIALPKRMPAVVLKAKGVIAPSFHHAFANPYRNSAFDGIAENPDAGACPNTALSGFLIKR